MGYYRMVCLRWYRRNDTARGIQATDAAQFAAGTIDPRNDCVRANTFYPCDIFGCVPRIHVDERADLEVGQFIVRMLQPATGALGFSRSRGLGWLIWSGQLR